MNWQKRALDQLNRNLTLTEQLTFDFKYTVTPLSINRQTQPIQRTTITWTTSCKLMFQRIAVSAMCDCDNGEKFQSQPLISKNLSPQRNTIQWATQRKESHQSFKSGVQRTSNELNVSVHWKELNTVRYNHTQRSAHVWNRCVLLSEAVSFQRKIHLTDPKSNVCTFRKPLETQHHKFNRQKFKCLMKLFFNTRKFPFCPLNVIPRSTSCLKYSLGIKFHCCIPCRIKCIVKLTSPFNKNAVNAPSAQCENSDIQTITHTLLLCSCMLIMLSL